MEHMQEHRKCYLYLLDTLSDWEIGYLTAELKSRRYLLKNINYDLLTVSTNLEPVTTMGGFLIQPDRTIHEVEFKGKDLFILPGAATWSEEKNKTILKLLPDLLEKQVFIAAICGATIALAQIGLLNNRKHTSNDKEVLKMFCPEYRGDAFYINEPAAIDHNLITASGLAPLEFTYAVLKTINVMKEETLEAWYNLYLTRESGYFYDLMKTL